MQIEDIRRRIEQAWKDPERRTARETAEAAEAAIDLLDRGEIRVAEKRGGERSGEWPDWVVNPWVKQSVLLYFATRQMEVQELGPFEYRDKVPLKRDYAKANVRVVPPAVARRGSYLAEGVVMMPSYVNIGARVGAGTMVDTWATVGSCAQIGERVHLSGGVGIGGVLEPVQGRPVIVEDGAFIGSRCIVVEGVVVGERAVLGANVVLTASTPVLDVRGESVVEHRGAVPPRSIVIPGTRPKRFPAGEFQIPAALIIGERSPETEKKVGLNALLREHGVSV